MDGTLAANNHSLNVAQFGLIVKTTPTKRRPPVHPDDVVQQVEEIVAEYLPPDSGVTDRDALVEIIEAVETAPRG